MAILITESAAREIQRLMDAKASGEKLYLRMTVSGGGCSGLQHKLDLDTETDPSTDETFAFQGIEVVVDKKSLVYLDGATIDYQDDLARRGFRIDNPNAKSTCGCGSSFSM